MVESGTKTKNENNDERGRSDEFRTSKGYLVTSAIYEGPSARVEVQGDFPNPAFQTHDLKTVFLFLSNPEEKCHGRGAHYFSEAFCCCGKFSMANI